MDIRETLKAGLFRPAWEGPQSKVAPNVQGIIVTAYTGTVQSIQYRVVYTVQKETFKDDQNELMLSLIVL